MVVVKLSGYPITTVPAVVPLGGVVDVYLEVSGLRKLVVVTIV